MNYVLYNCVTRNATYQANEDGTITATGVIAQSNIVGAPTGKFIQTDVMPPIIIPANQTTATQPAYIEAQAVQYVKDTYPNT